MRLTSSSQHFTTTIRVVAGGQLSRWRSYGRQQRFYPARVHSPCFTRLGILTNASLLHFSCVHPLRMRPAKTFTPLIAGNLDTLR